jgi:hypothetical protein
MAVGSRLRLVQPLCTRQACPLFGQSHPRCKAHAKRTDLAPCMNWPMSAQLVCDKHGGRQKSAVAKADKLVAQHEMRTRDSKIVAYDALDPSTPEEGLLMEVKWGGQVAIALGQACEALIADDTTDVASPRVERRADHRGASN